MLARRFGVPFRNQARHFIAKPPDRGIVHSGRDSDVNRADLVLTSGDLLEQWQRKNDRAVLNERAALNNPDYGELFSLDLNRVADLLFQDVRRGRSEDRRLLHLIVRHSSGNELEIVPREAAPFASGHDHELGGFDTHQIHEDLTGRGDSGQMRDPLARGCRKWLGRQGTAHVVNDDVGAARFHAGGPACDEAARHADERHHGGDAHGNS